MGQGTRSVSDKKAKTDTVEFPVTPETLTDFTDQIVNTVKHKQCLTYVFPQFFGGERAWIRFILDTNYTDIRTKLEEHKLVYFEPIEALEESKLGFFSAFYQSLSDNSDLNNDDLSFNQLWAKIDETVESIIKKQNLVIFITKLNSFKSFDAEYGNKLYCLWRKRKDKLSFVTTLSPENFEEFVNTSAGEFSETLLENVTYIQKLSSHDIEHTISHWETKLNTNFIPKQKQLIIKYSDGSPFKAKVLCQNLAVYKPGKDLADDLEIYMQKIISSRFSIKTQRKKLEYNETEGTIYLGSQIYGTHLTPSEYDILKLLIQKAPNLINRDEIADILWGKNQFERYSDWAIDKLISNLRKKIEETGYTVITSKGRGFYLSPLS